MSMVQVNAIRSRMAKGEPVLGCFVQTPAPQIVETLAVAGFDFVLIDAEHSAISPETAYPMILAAEARGMTAMARVGELDKQVILKYLDLGVAGVMAPQINTAEQAETAIAATKYVPRGTRGLAGGRIFDFALGAPAAAMVNDLSDRVLTIIQFEHIDALANLNAILDVPDLDVLFVGPNDLAQSMGYPGQPGHPKVTAIADEVVARCKAREIKTGTTIGDVASAKATIDRGFDMLVANATSLFAISAKVIADGVNTYRTNR